MSDQLNGDAYGTIGASQVLLPSEPLASEPLALPEPGSKPLRVRDLVMKSLDHANEHLINEINELQQQLEEMKQKICDDMDVCKGVIDRHFGVSAEAVANCDKIRRRMAYLAAGGNPDET